MICYRDMTFCSRDCNNTDCKRNKKNINKPKELEWMPVAYSDFKDCKVMMNDYINLEEEDEHERTEIVGEQNL